MLLRIFFLIISDMKTASCLCALPAADKYTQAKESIQFLISLNPFPNDKF